MANYTKTTNFTAKDSYSSGDSRKIVRGSEHDTEYNNIATAIGTKADSAAPALTGTATAENLTVSGTLTASSGASMGSNKITSVANPTSAQDAATKSYVDGLIPSTAGLLLNSNNLSDVSNTTTARTNLSAAKSGANSDITSLTGLTTPLTVAQGGIGAATLTANNVLLGNGTSAPLVVAPGTSGNVLTSNGTTWTSAASSNVYVGQKGQAFTAGGTFTIPTGVTALKVTVQGGGGGGGSSAAGGVLGAGNASIMKNRLINSAMVIDQRNAGASVTPINAQYTLDRWTTTVSQNSKFTVQQNAGSVTTPVGFTNYLGCTSSSAYTVGATETFSIAQYIEGYNIADLAWGTASAKTVTLSFQVYSSLTGTFGGSVRNGANDRCYPFSYSIPVANTWTAVSVTIAGDTTGTWLTTNGKGIWLNFSLGSGSSQSGTAGSWSATPVYSATGATSVVGTSGATFYITGVQLEVGSSATGFEYVNYQTSLANCQRYYAKMISSTINAPFGAGYVNSSTVAVYYIKYPTTMRSAPTFSTSNLVIESAVNNSTVTSVGTATAGTDALSVGLTASGGGQTTGQGTILRGSTTSSYVDFSAEL